MSGLQINKILTSVEQKFRLLLSAVWFKAGKPFIGSQFLDTQLLTDTWLWIMTRLPHPSENGNRLLNSRRDGLISD